MLTCAVMPDLLIAVNVKFVIMMGELKKVVSQNLKCLSSKITSPIRMNHTKNYGSQSLPFLFHYK